MSCWCRIWFCGHFDPLIAFTLIHSIEYLNIFNSADLKLRPERVEMKNPGALENTKLELTDSGNEIPSDSRISFAKNGL